MISKEEKEKIINAFQKKIPFLTCPMCASKGGFTMAEGYFLNSIQSDLTSINIGGQAIPAIAIICNNCGFISQHAMGSLELLPKINENITNDPK